MTDDVRDDTIGGLDATVDEPGTATGTEPDIAAGTGTVTDRPFDRHDDDGASHRTSEDGIEFDEGSVTLGNDSLGNDTEVAGAHAIAAPLGERIVARIVRRPVDWWNAPWTNERVVRLIVTSSALTITTVIMMMVIHLSPFGGERDLIFDNTTPTGGDMGAHVWAPAFLRDHLLPGGQISGWTMDWYGGLPLYRFYMVIPALMIVALDVILPYGVAFKLVAMSGLLLFPISCWAFGRLGGFRHPLPELFAFGGLCFLLDESFEIYGGNVKSTMAGEYSFSIALTLAMFGLGLLAHGLRTGKHRVWAAVFLSLAMVSHGIVLIFVAFAAATMCVVWIDRTRLVFAVTAGVTTILLSAWWVGPFLLGHEFMTDMKYGFRPSGVEDSFWDMFFPLTPALDIIITGLAIVGFGAFVLRRQLTGTALGLICALFVVGVYVTRDSLPIIGLLWNPRLLPFVYLTRYLLMVAGAFELISWVVNFARRRLADRELSGGEAASGFAVVGVSILLVFGWMYEVLPFDGRAVEQEASVYSWGPFRKGPTSGRAVADGWTRYNWQGYEGRDSYPAYDDLVNTMGGLGTDRGCGRAMWENNSANGEYGTTMALMLLPHWTDGCIGSMEGLFFEATASTNYHFITAATVSESSSNPVRQLRYTNNDAELGTRHLRDLGVRYLMVRTDAAKAEAATAPGLEFVALSGTWEVYEVSGSNVVEPLTIAPVVVDQAENQDWYKPGDDRERNLEVGTSWFQNREVWPAVPVDEGPDEWQRVTAAIDQGQRVEPFDDQRRRVDYVVPEVPIAPEQLPEIAVTDVEIRQQSIRFGVDQIGVPVMVKVSYFPNWRVSGADGPYRAGANHMIVVPTQTQVELTYDSRSGLDWFFYLLTAAGIALCVFWRFRGDVVHASEVPSFASASGDDAQAGRLDAGRAGPAATLDPGPPAPITFETRPDVPGDELRSADPAEAWRADLSERLPSSSGHAPEPPAVRSRRPAAAGSSEPPSEQSSPDSPPIAPPA